MVAGGGDGRLARGEGGFAGHGAGIERERLAEAGQRECGERGGAREP